MKKLTVLALALAPSLAFGEGAVHSDGGTNVSEALKIGYHFKCISAMDLSRVIELKHWAGENFGAITTAEGTMDAFVASGAGAISFIAIDGSTAYNYNVHPENKHFKFSRTGSQPQNDFGFCSIL